MVRERVERRRKWFRLAELPEAAQITLRIVNYRAEQHWILRRTLPWGIPGDPGQRGREYHFLAIVQGGDVRTTLSGLDERPVGIGPALRNAASHLAEELERFAKDNYGALSRLRAGAEVGEGADGGAADATGKLICVPTRFPRGQWPGNSPAFGIGPVGHSSFSPCWRPGRRRPADRKRRPGTLPSHFAFVAHQRSGRRGAEGEARRSNTDGSGTGGATAEMVPPGRLRRDGGRHSSHRQLPDRAGPVSPVPRE